MLLNDVVKDYLPATIAAMAFPMSTVDPVGAVPHAARIRSAAADSFRKSSMSAADRIAAVGFALPVPTMSGADPWDGSNLSLIHI